MSPDPAAVSDAPLRFDRAAVTEDADADAEPDAVEEARAPAGPPPLRDPGPLPVPARTSEVEEAAEPSLTRSERRAAQAAALVKPPKEPKAPKEPKPESVGRRQRRQDTKRRARKVKRIVRRFDAWSVMKVAFLFNLCAYVVTMVALILLWNVASGAGVIDNIESFIADMGAFETFEFEPDLLLQATALGGAVLAVLTTGLLALASVLFNLISDLVGGIRLTVIEEPAPTALDRSKSGGTDAEASDTVSEPSSGL